MSDFKDESYVEIKDEVFEKPGMGAKILGCMKKFLLAIIAAALLALLVFQLILISAIGEVKAIADIDIPVVPGEWTNTGRPSVALSREGQEGERYFADECDSPGTYTNIWRSKIDWSNWSDFPECSFLGILPVSLSALSLYFPLAHKDSICPSRIASDVSFQLSTKQKHSKSKSPSL